jgi:CubicO group peptidase (beta-lactamase class C family)
MDRVIAGLRPSFAIKGETPTRWSLAERMAFYKVPGVSIAIVDSGRIIWAKGFGVKEAGGTDSVTTETLFQAGSVSKPTFALGVMRLVQDGKLNLDDNVNDKLVSWKVPDNRFTATEKVTLRRILSHSAGLTVHGFPGYEAGTPIPTLPQVLDGVKPIVNTDPVRVDTFPGAIWRYSGGGTTIAQLLVTEFTKKPFPTFMQEMVLDPAGMTHSTYEQPLPAAWAPRAATGHDTAGVAIKGKYHTYPEMAAAGLWTTPSDLATLAIELQKTDAGASSKVVSQATLKQMFTVQKAPLGIGYFLVGEGKDLEFQHSGGDDGFITEFAAFAERGQGAFIMTNGLNGYNIIAEVIPAIAEEYGWPIRRQTVKTPVALDTKALSQVAGHYRFDAMNGFVATISIDNGKLYIDAAGPQPKQELVAAGDSVFFGHETGVPFVFRKRVNGKATELLVAGSAVGVRPK